MDEHEALVRFLRSRSLRAGKAGYLLTELLHRCADIIEHQADMLEQMQQAIAAIEAEWQLQYEQCGEAQEKATTLQRKLAESEAIVARLHRARS